MMNFSNDNTNIAKGIALLLLLLWHHLFYDFIADNTGVGLIAYYGKVCVAIFLILSGYGLVKSFSKQIDKSGFIWRNIKKIYTNYWFVWLLFVPVGVLFFGRTLQDAYVQNIIPKLVIELTGLQKVIFGFHGYNPTWWFIGLLIGFYLIFPQLYKILKKYPFIFIFFSLIITIIPIFRLVPFIGNILNNYAVWLFPFALGMIFAEYNLFVKIKSYQYSNNKYLKAVLMLGILGFLLIFRKYGFIITDIKIDGLLGIIIVVMSFEYITITSYIGKILNYLGRHSFNIFLFHTFIYYYYFTDFIYAFKNNIIIFLVMLVFCILISVGIEQIRTYFKNTTKMFIN